MPGRLFTTAICLLWLASDRLAATEPRYVIESAEARKVDAAISYQIETTLFSVERWSIFLPKPPELPGQIKVKATTTPVSRAVFEKSLLARQVFMIEQRATPATMKRIEMELKVEAILLSRKLGLLSENAPKPKVALLKDTERKFYTSPSHMVDFDSQNFREWLFARKLKRQVGEPEIVFAERVLEEIRSQFEYGFDPDQDKRASLACARGKTDCGGMAFIFVGAMRANGIPTRTLLGRLAKPREEGSKPGDLSYDRPHARAEFYVPDVGWVPVDPNAVQADKSKDVKTFIGSDDGDMLVLHVDVDMQLPFTRQVERVGFMQVSPYFHAYGTGPFDAKVGLSGWKVKSEPIIK